MPDDNMSRIEQLREERSEAIRRATELADAVEAEGRDFTEEESAQFDADTALVDSRTAEIERMEKAAALRPQLRAADAVPPRDPVDVISPARARNPESEEKTYRPDNMSERSFFRDLLLAKEGHIDVRERLERNRREAIEAFGYSDREGQEYRDMSNTATAGAEFIPPLYLSALAVAPNVAGRPLADALPKMPLPPTGTTISIPKLSSGVAVAARSDAGAVQETDGVTATVTHYVNEIAGQVDIGRIAVMRSDPALDVFVQQTLVRRYNAYLDTQLLSGSGTPPAHKGLDNVTSPNTVTFTQATPTAANTLPPIFDAIQKVVSNRLEVYADLIVMHPRRAAFINSSLSSTVPIFQQGSLMQAVGSQDQGFAQSLGGIQILQDPNITVTAGAGTNQDVIYVLAREDFVLMEGPLMARVWDDVGSGNGLIRYQAFAFSAFLSDRYPKSLSIISGTGLVTPTFA